MTQKDTTDKTVFACPACLEEAVFHGRLENYPNDNRIYFKCRNENCEAYDHKLLSALTAKRKTVPKSVWGYNYLTGKDSY